MTGLKRFPRIITSFYIIGYIFSFFALFYRTRWLFAAITFAVSLTLHLLHLTSLEARSSRALIRAKKLIDKGDTDRAVDHLLDAAKIQPNEEMLVQINALVKKNPGNYGKAAEALSLRFDEFDSPFIRFVASSFFYTSKNLSRAKEMLADIPPEQLSVKAIRLLGSIFYEQKEYAKAIKVFQTRNPVKAPASEDDLAIIYGIAICHIAKKESKKAIEFLERIRAKSPKYGNAEKLIAQLKEESEKK